MNNDLTTEQLIKKVEEQEKQLAQQAELQDNLAMLNEVTRNMFDMVALFSLEGKIMYASPSYERILGYQPEVGQDMMDFVHPDDVEEVVADMTKFINDHVPQSHELRIRKADGSYLIVETISRIQKNDNGEITGFITSTRDITERKNSEINLQEKNEEYEAAIEELRQTNDELLAARQAAEENEIKLKQSDRVFNLTLDMFCIAGFDGYFKYLNPAWERTLGWSIEELLSKPWLDFVHPDDAENTENIKSVIVDGKEIYKFENRYISKDGSIKWLSWNSQPFPKENIMIGAVRDITETKIIENELLQAKEKAEENETKFKAAFYTSPDSVNINTLDGEYIEVNEGFTRLTGYTEKDVIGKFSSEINIWSIPEDREKLIAGLKKNGIVENLESLFQAKDGTLIPALMSARIISLKDEPHILSVTRAFVERKEMEQELIKSKEEAEESKNFLQTIFENIPNMIFLKNADDLSFAFFNKAGEKLLGYKSEELIGKNDYDFFPKEQAEFFIEKDKNVLKGKEILSIAEEEINTKSGKRFLSTKKTTIHNSEGKPKYLFGISEDITKYKESEQELIAAKEQAENANRLKTEFLHNMSHEIRTPLNGIMGFSEILNNPNISEEKRNNYSKIIRNSGEQLLRVVDDILEISTLETKQTKLDETEFCLNDLLMELFSIFNLNSAEKNVPIYLEKPLHDKEVLIISDKTKLNKILSNLIENAIKFTTKGSIEIGYHVETDFIKLYVSDTGIGISAENQQKIFERFSQEDEDIAGTYGGLGLGLSICKENAQLLGGDITLESQKGSGSKFIVTIPYKPAGNSAPETIKPTFEEQSTEDKPVTILVAEDEEMNYLYIEALFEDEVELNYNLIHAKNGKEALDICLENQDIDLVLMDIKMPVMNGNTATMKIKTRFPDLPVIAQTAYSTESEKAEAMKHGYNDFMSKPIDKDRMFETINKFVSVK